MWSRTARSTIPTAGATVRSWSRGVSWLGRYLSDLTYPAFFWSSSGLCCNAFCFFLIAIILCVFSHHKLFHQINFLPTNRCGVGRRIGRRTGLFHQHVRAPRQALGESAHRLGVGGGRGQFGHHCQVLGTARQKQRGDAPADGGGALSGGGVRKDFQDAGFDPVDAALNGCEWDG